MQKRQQVRWSWLAAFASLAVVLTGAMATSASAAKSAQGVCATSAKNQLQSQTNAHEAPCGSAWVDVAPLPQTLFGPATTTRRHLRLRLRRLPLPGGRWLDVEHCSTATTRSRTRGRRWLRCRSRRSIASAVYYPPTNKIYVFGGSDTDSRSDRRLRYDVDLRHHIDTWSLGRSHAGPAFPKWAPATTRRTGRST